MQRVAALQLIISKIVCFFPIMTNLLFLKKRLSKLHHLHLFTFATRMVFAILGFVLLSSLVSCQQSSEWSSTGAGSSSGEEVNSANNTTVVLNAFTDFNCTGGWSNRDGALGLTAGAGSGTCDVAFPGGSGKYRVQVKIQTEFDGRPIYKVSINGNTIREGIYPTSTSTVRCVCDNWRVNCPDKNVVIDAGIHQIKTGDVIRFYGEEVYPCGKHGAYAKWHSITLTPVN